MLPVLQIGPLALPVPQFSLLLSIWVGLSLVEKNAFRKNLSADTLYNLVFVILGVGVTGARLGYIMQYPLVFWNNPGNIISLNPGLLDGFSGVAMGVLAGFIYGHRKKLTFWNTLDALTPLFATFFIGMALGHFASGTAYGAETNLPWAIELWGAKRHPSQVYELIASVCILAFTLFHLKTGQKAGEVFLNFIALGAGAILFLEGFRGDSSTTLLGIRSVQIIAWMILACTFYIMGYKNRQTEIRNKNNG